jgi:hypothetical protein
VECYEIEIRIEGGAIIGKGRSVNDIAKSEGTFMNKTFPGPDIPDRLSGPTRSHDHNRCSPSVP